ncbi:MAG: 4Fe-4S cluster-binding domain-containing protein [bacterium]
MITKPNISIMFTGTFPANFRNDVHGWNFSQEELQKNEGKLLTIDIDFGKICSLNCPHCFRRSNNADAGHSKPMAYDETAQIILDAKKLGLRSVKFLGAGEPFENGRFIEFLRFLKEQEVIPAIKSPAVCM